MRDIKFKISLILDNLITGKLDSISKTVTKKNIEIEHGIAVEIDKRNILNFFERDINRYCTKNNIDMEHVVVDGYEIKSKDKDVDIYFKSEDLEQFSFEPSIMARLIAPKRMAILRCEQVDETSIRWYWEPDEKAHYLVDERGDIVAHIPLDVDYYIEGDLEPGQTYRRYLVSYDATDIELRSTECSITLIQDKKPAEYTVFKVEKRKEDLTPLNTEYSSRLKAFASGVGDGNDCKLFKPDDTSYDKKFKLINKVYGVRASNEVKHHTIKFKYRFKLSGLVDHITYNAYAKVRVTATEIVSLPDEPNSKPLGKPFVCTRDLEYFFDEKTQVADIYLYSIVPEIANNYKKRYKFDIEVLETKGPITIFSYTHGYVKLDNKEVISFTEKGFYDHKFSIKAEPVVIQKEYTEIYPPVKFEPLVGAVNGDFEVHKDGMKEMRATAPIFSTSELVKDKKYYCIIEDISPEDAYVQYRFDEQVGEDDFTRKNGDGILFYSDCILEDETEYRDFLAQIEQGEFVISDNRRHKYSYDIDEITVNPKQFKRFELDVVPSTNDVVILSNTRDLEVNENNQISSTINVTVRGIQNAISKWNPMIHNGYYYYNQDEYFLYSKCIAEGEGRIVEDVFYTPTVSVKAIIEATSPSGPIENYVFELNTKEDLLLNTSLFLWEDNMIWPKPFNVPNDYFMDYHEVYNYYTSPFIFDKVPTRYDSITWDEVCEGKNELNVYGEAYDDVFGVWSDPILLTNGGEVPEELKKVKVLRLKVEMKPSRLPEAITRNLLYNSEAKWRNFMDKFLSSNLYYREEVLMPKSRLSSGHFISEIVDLGDSAEETKRRAVNLDLKKTGDVEFYIQDADTKTELDEKLNNDLWVKVSLGETKKNLKRFVRYRLVLKPSSKIYSAVFKTTRYEYSEMEKTEYIPGFGNVRVEATFDPVATNIVYESIIAHNLKFDAKEHILLKSLDEYVDIYASAHGFNKEQVVSINLMPYGSHQDEFTIRKNIGDVDAETGQIINDFVTIQSAEVLYDHELLEANQAGAKFPVNENGVINVSPIPQQYSPVLLSEVDSDETYTQVFFTDEDGMFTLYNIEEFESLGFKTIYLKYLGIDHQTVSVEVDGSKIENFQVKDNVLVFENEIYAGAIVKVKYKLKNSFYVNYNYMEDTAEIVIHKEEDQPYPELYRVFYETNKISALRPLKDICMNPIYNACYGGYIYICDYELAPHLVKVIPEDTFIFANGKDTMNVLIKVEDSNGNPVENIDVNVVAAAGRIEKLHDKTDINGVIKCTYTSWTGDCEDVIKATATDKVRGKATIINRKL